MVIVQQPIPLAGRRESRNLEKGSSGSVGRRLLAYTLVEVLLAILVVSVTFAGFYLCLSQGFASTEVNREELRATQLLMQQMETIRLYTWDQINSNGFIPSKFTAPFEAVGTPSSNAPVYTGRITIKKAPMTESYATNHVFVTVDLKWNSGNGAVPHALSMSTIVSQYGLHNYFY